MLARRGGSAVKLSLPAFVAVSVAAFPALGKPLFTPPAGVVGTATAACLVQNVSTKPADVSAIIRNQDGGAILGHEDTVPAGAVLTFVSADNDFGVYCEFEGLRKGVRGYLHVYDGTTVTLLPAVK
jgi:hypothetical protein